MIKVENSYRYTGVDQTLPKNTGFFYLKYIGTLV